MPNTEVGGSASAPAWTPDLTAPDWKTDPTIKALRQAVKRGFSEDYGQELDALCSAVAALAQPAGPTPYPVKYPDDEETKRCREIASRVNDTTLNDETWRVSVNQVRQILRAIAPVR